MKKEKMGSPEPNQGLVASSYKVIGSDSRKEALTVRLEKNTKHLIEKLAKENGISKAKVVRKLLKRELEGFK